jgi:sugar O-acyltransferase (sialic acid O-acetyltransferase NeuD family)
MSKRWIIIGAGGHGMVVAESIEAMGEEVLGFYDDDQTKKNCLDYPVLDNQSFDKDTGDIDFVIAIGNNEIRHAYADKGFSHKRKVIHPSAVISRNSTVDTGTMIMPGAIVNAKSNIGKHCILNTNSSVDHECTVGDFVHIAPAATLAGNVEVGEGSLIGMGAVVLPYVKIGKWCKIGAGAVVVKDVPDGKTVIGVPAKIK